MRCNYRCIYCQNYRTPVSGNSWFPLNHLRAVLPILRRSCWSVYLSCGGEPLLHPKFQEAMSIVNDTLGGIDVVLVTNGRLLDEKKSRAILDSCVSRVQVSVHTVDPALYGRLYGCGESDLSVVTGNVEAMVRARKGKKWPKILITSIAMQSTLSGLPQVARWAAEAGVDGMRVQWIEPFDTMGMDKEVIHGTTEAFATLTEVQRILSAKGAFLDWPSSFKAKKIQSLLRSASTVHGKFHYFLAAAGKYRALRANRTCTIAGQTIRLTSGGDIRFCHRDAVAMPNLLEHPSINLSRVVKDAVKSLDCRSNQHCEACPFHP
jgi:molybdenum cofactor biosynthesis enzyme MoaA